MIELGRRRILRKVKDAASPRNANYIVKVVTHPPSDRPQTHRQRLLKTNLVFSTSSTEHTQRNEVIAD